jgi:hypothetical protein
MGSGGEIPADRLRLRHRLDIQLARQQLAAGLVLLQGVRPPSCPEVEPDDFAVNLFPKGIQLKNPAGASEGTVHLADFAETTHQAAQAVEVEQTQPLPLAQGPIVLEPIEQVAGLLGQSRFFGGEVALLRIADLLQAPHPVPKGGHIQPIVALAVEAHLAARAEDEVGPARDRPRLEYLSQAPQRGTQAAARLGIGVLTQGDSSQGLAVVESLPMEPEVGQQSLHAVDESERAGHPIMCHPAVPNE